MKKSLASRRAKPALILVDDDNAVLRALSLMLRTAGYAVSGYPGGADLLAAPLPGDCDVLLVDYVMPGIDGLTLVARLRARGWQGDAVLITGRFDVELSERAAAAGVTSIVEKPLDKAALLGAIMATAANDQAPTGP